MEDLFRSDCVFISDKTTKEEIFAEVGSALLTKGWVTEDFAAHVIEREKNYPTGIDLEILQRNLPNVGVPHTESMYVKTRMIVPIKLKQDVMFHNMIDPSKEMSVRFLFMILNNDPEGQANMLAAIMDFLTKSDAEALNKVFASEDKETIYTFLTNNFQS